jgi:hypothetical protein
MDLFSWFQSHETLLGVAASLFGCGLKFKWLCEKLSQLLSWMATAQGQAAIKDLDAALDVVFQSLKDAGHPAPQDVIVAIQSTISSAEAAALKLEPAPAPAPAPQAMAPVQRSVSPLAILMLAGLLALGAVCSATTYDLSIGSPVGSSVWRFAEGGKLVSEGSTVAGLGLIFSYGATDAAGLYTPYIATLAGVGGETYNADNYADAYVGLGPVLPGVKIPLFGAAVWRCGTGQLPAIMLCTSLSYDLSLWRHTK